MNRMKLESMTADSLRMKVQNNLEENQQIREELRRRQVLKDEKEVLTDEELEALLGFGG